MATLQSANWKKRAPCAAALLAASLLCLPAAPARADLTLAARRTVGIGASAPPPTQAIRLFCKGTAARLEAAGAPTLLYDGKSNILYGVNTPRKTYFLTVPTPFDPTAEVFSKPGDQVAADVKLDLRRTGRTQTLVGLTAHQFTVTGIVTFTFNRPDRDKSEEEEREAEGETPGGRRHGRGRRGPPPVLPKWSLAGDLWLADTLQFPAKENLFLTAQLVAVSAGPFGPSLADALSSRGVPLLSRLVVSYTPGSPGSEAPVPAVPAVPVTTVTNWTVLSFSASQLTDTLFQPPAGDALIAAPSSADDLSLPPISPPVAP